MIGRVLAIACALSLAPALWADQQGVRVEAPDLQGSGLMDRNTPQGEMNEKRTEAAVIRDYVESWQSLVTALDQNEPQLLNPEFTGQAQRRLADTIAEQAKAGIHTVYTNPTHDIQVVFYSPDGLSMELVDNATYDEEIYDGGKVLTTQHVTARYLVVMTPAAVRWMVRMMQAEPAQ